MHNHSAHDGKWMVIMVALCALPLVILLFAQEGTRWRWFILGIVAAYGIIHVLVMRRHGGVEKHPEDTSGQSHHHEQ